MLHSIVVYGIPVENEKFYPIDPTVAITSLTTRPARNGSDIGLPAPSSRYW